jgi:hypothetical protein
VTDLWAAAAPDEAAAVDAAVAAESSVAVAAESNVAVADTVRWIDYIQDTELHSDPEADHSFASHMAQIWR